MPPKTIFCIKQGTVVTKLLKVITREEIKGKSVDELIAYTRNKMTEAMKEGNKTISNERLNKKVFSIEMFLAFFVMLFEIFLEFYLMYRVTCFIKSFLW